LNDKQPPVFNKHLHKSIVAAEIVLGPKALKRLVAGLLTDFSCNHMQLDKELSNILGTVFKFIDPKKQVVIKTDPGVPDGLLMRDEPKESAIDDDFEGYAMVDIKTAIAAAIRDDLTGFVLQALQMKWERELTLDDAENISFHLHKLIKLLT